jgi:hypothetical protein
MERPRIFLSYVKADQSWADRLATLLTSAGIEFNDPLSGPPANQQTADHWRHAIATSTHTLVLLGQTTRLSKWVDRE